MVLLTVSSIFASSHREAPLISNDPLADNVDLYAFRSPDNPDMITIIATYVPLQLPHGGPNYYTFGENVRYEIHVDNDASVAGDEILYRFTFDIVNEDPTTFFNIRLGQQNQKASYTLERSVDGGMTFETIVTDGYVPPNNIGPRSIASPVGLNSSYADLMQNAITTTSTGETVFAGPTDDPFFVDLGGIFDLGDAPRQNGEPRDGVACYNVSAIAIQVPISTLLKEGAPSQPTNILDSDYVIGVWASASRPAMTTFTKEDGVTTSGDWVQVSRLGMPLTNEAVIPIGSKDYWNSITPYDEISETTLDEFFYNPELALYMDDSQFGGAVPAFAPLRIQSNSLGSFDFRNGQDGLFPLKGNPALAGTALDDAVFGTLLLPAEGKPRSVDLWPAFHTGVPNVRPYQLATGKGGDPLAAGKPFVNNFLPNGGDMLRLNMAVPPTPRDDANFSSLGLVQAAAIGLTVAPFNETADLEFIPNMDGFPNGRRLEDDVTRIELQAVSGVVLAAIGLWYDDYDPMTSASPVTEDLLNVLTYTTGVEENDEPFTGTFPYLAMPHSGTGDCSGELVFKQQQPVADADVKVLISSNNTGKVGLYSYDDQGSSSISTFDVAGNDADGIYYDEEEDVIYQLNRSDNVINAYSNAFANLNAGGTPDLTATSTSDFSNGREIAVSNGKLVVAQDANDANGNVNQFVVYDASPNSITLDKTLVADINLWGIAFGGDALFAVVDNSSDIAVYDDFLNAPAGNISPSRTITVDGIVRTHGLTYNINNDIMVLTDVGSGGDPDDGALIYVNQWSAASADGVVTAAEQLRIEGPMSTLGNPVDVAYDHVTGRIFVAERANAGGRFLVFEVPSANGDAAPMTNDFFQGASAVFLSDCREPAVQESIVYYSLNQCTSFGSDGSNLNYSEFVPEYPVALSCNVINATNLFRENPSANGHSCTPGVQGSEAMCVSAVDNCDYTPDSEQATVFEVTITSQGGEATTVSGLNFYEKAPEMYDWISGPSGQNNYPTKYGVRVLRDGNEIFRSDENEATLDWTLEEFSFSGQDFVVNGSATFRIELLGYCLVGNGAPVAAWDLDEVNLLGSCGLNNKAAIRGTVMTMDGQPLSNVKVVAESAQDNYPITTTSDVDGNFEFENNPTDQHYMIRGDKKDNALNGVSTLDILLIQRHILGIEQLDSPFKMIAADVNFNEAITAADLVELRRLILGIEDQFEGNKSWIFADGNNQHLTSDPFSGEDAIIIPNLAADIDNGQLVAIKVGDVNLDSKENLGQNDFQEKNYRQLNLYTSNKSVESGETVALEITSDNFSEVNGMQMTLNLTDAKFVNIIGGAITIGTSNYAQLDSDMVTFSWNQNEMMNVTNDDVLFTVLIQPTTSGFVEDLIKVSSDFTVSESYLGKQYNKAEVKLNYTQVANEIKGYHLSQNQPNPFSEYTVIDVQMEEAGNATLKLFDTNGKLIQQLNRSFDAGLNQFRLDKRTLKGYAGVLIYKLEVNGFVDTKFMTIIK